MATTTLCVIPADLKVAWRPLLWITVLSAALLAGCGSQELYSQLSERQANEMVALLRASGIDADKQVQEGRFSVVAPRSDFAEAVRLLNAQGYPRENFDSMGKVFKREGFVSSPLEERARLMHAMSQEISNTLASIDGVVAARVHLVVPERHPLMDKPQPAAASVFIKHRPDKDLSGQVTQIKALVVNSLEGLSYDNVTVALFPAEAMTSDAPKAAAAGGGAAREAALKVPLLLGAAIGSAVLLASGLLWWRRRGAARPIRQEPLGLPAPARALPGQDFEAALRRSAGVK